MKAFADGRNLVDILTQEGFVTKKGLAVSILYILHQISEMFI